MDFWLFTYYLCTHPSRYIRAPDLSIDSILHYTSLLFMATIASLTQRQPAPSRSPGTPLRSTEEIPASSPSTLLPALRLPRRLATDGSVFGRRPARRLTGRSWYVVWSRLTGRRWARRLGRQCLRPRSWWPPVTSSCAPSLPALKDRRSPTRRRRRSGKWGLRITRDIDPRCHAYEATSSA